MRRASVYRQPVSVLVEYRKYGWKVQQGLPLGLSVQVFGLDRLDVSAHAEEDLYHRGLETSPGLLQDHVDDLVVRDGTPIGAIHGERVEEIYHGADPRG